MLTLLSEIQPGSHRDRHTLFCDFDGPLLDVSRRYYCTYSLALRETQKELAELGEVWRPRRLSFRQFWSMKQAHLPDPAIAQRSGLAPEHFDRFLKHVRSRVNQPELLKLDRLQLGVRWAFSLIQQAGLDLSIVTLRPEAEVREILQREHLDHCITEIFGGDSDLTAYENPVSIKREILGQAIAAANAAGRPGLAMVGDTEADVLAAQAHAVPAVALTCGIRSRRYLEGLEPDAIYPNLLIFCHQQLRVLQPA